MSLPHLSLADARNLHLAAQGLLNKPRRQASLEDIPATISRMSLLQIDTINIVARSPYLVLFSRLGNYPAQWLDESLARGELMEYWAHEACFMPRSDFRLIRHRMLAPEKMGWKYKDAWMQEHEAEIAQLIQHIHDKGPVRSADFEHPRKGASGWWEWKPHKRHLEGLFTAGKVMVIERRNFQRVYDLTHRVMPDWDDERDLVSQTEAEIIMLDNSARSLGIFREQWLADYYRLKRPALRRGAKRGLNSSKSLLCMLKNWAIFGCMLICCRYSSVRWPESSLQRTARYFRLLILLSGIANAQSSFLILATGWSAIPQRRNASMAILFCHYYIVGN
ncbi:hypothetical protein OkiPb00643_00870 [Escherichia coli]